MYGNISKFHFNRNIMHGSDSVESANKEIALWFKDEELVSWQPAAKCWVYEDWKVSIIVCSLLS